jgi:hypothetical protein
MRTTPIALTSLVAGLALAAAAAAQPPAPAAAPPGEKAAPAATPALPGSATTARENSRGPEHASDTAKDQASPDSVVAPATSADASATAPVADDATPATDPKPRKAREPGKGVSPLKPH